MTNELSKTNVLEYEARSPDDTWRSGNLVLTGLASGRPITSAHTQFVSAPNLEVRGKLSNARTAKGDAKTNASDVSPDAPLRLEVAAQLAFPGGGITAAGLRKEARRGKLAVERIAGKDYTTLSAIEDMRALCRTNPKVLDYGSSPPTKARTQAGSSETEQGLSAQAAALASAAKLKNASRRT
jgi:hypothetical protein